MCLYVNNDHKKPNDNAIRWKILKADYFKSQSYIEGFQSCSFHFTWKKGWNVAEINGNQSSDGFHVFLSRKQAIQEFYNYSCGLERARIVRMVVKGFLAGGYFDGFFGAERGDPQEAERGDPQETWKFAKILTAYKLVGDDLVEVKYKEDR